MDDSGTRRPDRAPLAFDKSKRDFFALGGVLVNDEAIPEIKQTHQEFRQRWGIDYPLHSVEIRNRKQAFSWLARDPAMHDAFMADLTSFLTALPVVGLACVIDRPGYDFRFREKYGRQQWRLCRTAFCIAVERAAKWASAQGRKLRVLPERCNRKDDSRLNTYYQELRTAGMPFQEASEKYSPLSQPELSSTLHDLDFKHKSSPLTQLADLYLWPLAVAGYNPTYRPHVDLREAGRLIECHLAPEQCEVSGTKYSCFELVRAP